MSITRSNDYIKSLIRELLKQPNETEWLEFKHNNDDKARKYIPWWAK
jgi:hypothetical protein